MMRLTALYADIWTASLPGTNGALDEFCALPRQFENSCEEEGRDPAEIRKMVEVVVSVPGGPHSRWSDGHTIRGYTPSAIANQLSAYYEAGAGQIMVWIEPTSKAGIERLSEAGRLAKRSN